MEHLKTPPLTTSKEIFVVTGMSGAYEDKNCWLVNAYSTHSGALAAAKFLQQEADKIQDKYEYYDNMNAINNLKLYDSNAWYQDGGIYYIVESVVYVV
jgi:hypothetical protein